MAEPHSPIPSRWAGFVFVVVWLAALGVMQWSVVRFKVSIVLTLTAAAGLLAVWVFRRLAVRLDLIQVGMIALGSALILWRVPMFSYLSGGEQSLVVGVLCAGGALAVGLLAIGARSSGVGTKRAGATRAGATRAGATRAGATRAAYGVLIATHAAASAVTIRGDGAPRIDVWVILQQASDVTADVGNMYATTWTGSPGVRDAFPYLPGMILAVGPGRWLAGDVRWALLVWTVALLLGMWLLAGTVRGRWRMPHAAARSGGVVAVGAGVLLVLAPGTVTQIDQAWTEPVLAALLVLWAWLVASGRGWWAVVPLALACASKQHLLLLVPLLMMWREFGWKRVLTTGALSGVILAPWVLADAAAFWQDTVTLLVGFHPIRFANTWYLLALNEFGVTLPFAVTGAVLVGVSLGAAGWVWLRQPALDELLRLLALVLLVANLVNKQAFYNQFWLSAALVVASLAAGSADPAVAAESVQGSPGPQTLEPVLRERGTAGPEDGAEGRVGRSQQV